MSTTRNAVPTRLVTLGGFALVRDGERMPDSAFRRSKSKAILAALACAGGSVHRDRLVEWFWPGLPPDRATSAFFTTLASLRRTLEPGLPARAASRYILSERGTYRLARSPLVVWDCEEFMRLARAALRATAALEDVLEAEAAFTGPLLPEWPDAPWAEACREEVDGARARLEERAAELLLERDPVEASWRYERLLRRDPAIESWHRGLMRAYAARDELALALRQFQTCRRILREEFGVEPSEHTRRLYRELRNSRY